MKLVRLGHYQIWADDLIREIILKLSKEEFMEKIIPENASVRDLCIHIVISIEFNIRKWIEKEEVNPDELYEELYSLSKEKLLQRWKEADECLLENMKKREKPIEFLNFLTEELFTIDRNDFFLQYITHTVYHRGQLMSALKNLGKEGITTDYLFYLFELDKNK